jgi:hypothetical protein
MEAALREIALNNGHLTCPECHKVTRLLYRQLWAPHDPTSRAKCDRCGEWSYVSAWLGIPDATDMEVA